MTGYTSETLANAAVLMAGLQQFVQDATDLDYATFAFTVSVVTPTDQYLKFALSDDGNNVVLDA